MIRLPKRMTITKGPKKPTVDPVPEVEEEVEGSVRGGTRPIGQANKPIPNPLPDPTHQRSTVFFQSLPKSQHGHHHTGASASPTADHNIVSSNRSAAVHSTAAQSPIHPETDRLFIPKDEFGSLSRDELRPAATFNYSRTMGYLVLADDVLRKPWTSLLAKKPRWVSRENV